MPDMIFICYADEKFIMQQERSIQAAINVGFQYYSTYNRDDLINTEFYKENKYILDLSRGGGYWLWKPFFILEAFKRISKNDIVVYSDCGDICNNGIVEFVSSYMNTNDILLVGREFINRQWTKRDCFVLMNCDSDNFHNGTQLEAGFCCFKKTDSVTSFLEEWLMYGKNKNIITDEPNICGKDNFPDFKDHRHDQSILSLLSIKYNIPRVGVGNFISYNV